MKIHFIGICGAGMSAVAKLAQDLNYKVTGSDEGFYPPISTYLKDHKIKCNTPYNAKNIPKDVDIIVIGKHAKLDGENPEVKKAYELCGDPEIKNSNKNKKVKLLSFPELLRDFTKERENIIVGGSYGKSTCTSLMSFVLEDNKKHPGYFIGAASITPKENAVIGKSKYFIFEGDEYLSSNWDNTSKFLYYNAHDLLITATAHDHVNVFPTHEDYKKPFIELIKNIPKDGFVVLCADDITNLNMHKKYFSKNKNIIFYSLEKKDKSSFYAKNIKYSKTTKFDLYQNNKKVITLETTLLGKHNIQNIVGVAALLLTKKLINKNELAKGIKRFKGIKRRLDLINKYKGILMYEGFGSSYEKARAAIEAIVLHYPKKELNIIFEPHTFSWRNKNSLHWYKDVFREAKNVLLYEPPTHGAASHDQSSYEEIFTTIKNSGVFVERINKINGLAKIKKTIKKDSIFLILSSGNMDGLLDKVKKLK